MAESSDWYAGHVATFGDRLSGAREAAGMTQEQLAKRLGVREATIRAWEDDAKDPRANRLQMIAGMLNVSIRWLLTGEGDGLEMPTEQGPLSEPAQAALKDIARMRARMMALANELGQMEKQLRHLLRDGE